MKNLTNVLLLAATLALTIAPTLVFAKGGNNRNGDKHEDKKDKGGHGGGVDIGHGGGGAPEPASMALMFAGASYLVGRKALNKRNRKNSSEDQQ